jgi:hypothetical protein
MGYEIVYSYHKKLQDGTGYNKDETETINRRIGEPFDDIPLDQVAAAIMQQMARRDIWVIGVEIHEYKKNKVTFREVDGGIVIKNRKFQLDQGANLISQALKSTEIPEVNGHIQARPQSIEALIDAGPMPVMRPMVPQADPNLPAEQVQANPKRRVRRWVVFQPELPQLQEARQKGLKCREGQKYPVFEEKEHPMGLQFGMVFTIMDDMHREVQCSDKYFVPATVRLEKDLGSDPFHNPLSAEGAPKLIWPGEVVEQDLNVPDVRRVASRGGRLPAPDQGGGGGQGVPDVRRMAAQGTKLPPLQQGSFDDGLQGVQDDMPMPDIRRGRGR